jgi:hypothetical protein
MNSSIIKLIVIDILMLFDLLKVMERYMIFNYLLICLLAKRRVF